MYHLIHISSLRSILPALLTSVLIHIISVFALAQSEELELVGSWQEGPSYGLEIVDNYVFTNSGSYLNIIDITNPEESFIVAKFLSKGFIHDIHLEGDIAYLAIYELGLQIINISDLENIVEINFIPMEGSYPVLLLKDNIVYYAAQYHLFIVDVQDINNPQVIADHESEMWLRRLHLDGERIIASAARDGVRIFDIKEDGDVEEAGFIKRTGMFVYDADVEEDLCFIAGNDSIIVYDISDPGQALWKGGVPLSRASFVEVWNNTVFASTVYAANISIIDVNNQGLPEIKHQSTTEMSGALRSFKIADDNVFMVSSNGILLQANIDNHEITNIYQERFGHSYAYDIGIYDDMVFMAQSDFGYGLIDATDPSNPVFLQDIGPNLIGNYFAIDGHYLYSLRGGLMIIDISDPVFPVLNSYYQIGGSLRDVIVRDNLVYIADFYDGLIIFDVSDPHNPVLMSTIAPEEGDIVSVELKGDLVFCGARFGGLVIFDVSNPQEPELIGQLQELGNVSYVKPVGNYAYVYPYYDPGLLVDVSDPSNPAELDWELGNSVKDILLADKYAFLISTTDGLTVFDVSDPAAPVNLANYQVPGNPYTGVMYNNQLYIADSYCGLFIIAFQPLVGSGKVDGKNESSISVYPNPFTKDLNIHLDLNERSSVAIDILDANSRLVKKLYDSTLPAGQYEFKTSFYKDTMGVYIIRSIINGKVFTEKIMGLK